MTYLALLLRGFLMGAADIVPGVSGGTIALIVGIYPRLIGNLSAIRIKRPIQTIAWSFFIPLGIGILAAVFSLSSLLHTALEGHPGPTYSFFLGLILISGLILLKKIKAWGPTTLLSLLLGAVISFIFIGLNPIAQLHNPLITFFSGSIAITAMILPGISGSFLLLILGQYKYILNAIHTLDLLTLTLFALGIISGLLAFSRLLHHLLAKHHSTTLAFLIGMIFGSLRLPIREISMAHPPLIQVVAMSLLGAVLIAGIEYTSTQKKASPLPQKSL